MTALISNRLRRELKDLAFKPVSVLDYIKTSVDGFTSNQAGIVAAVAAAKAEGFDLYWHAGTYVSDANIPDFHSVRHFGPGVIKRSADIFHVSPSDGQTNTLYVSTVGDDANDGFSAATARRTVAGAMLYLASPSMPAMLQSGQLRVKFGPGEWIDGGSFAGNLVSKNYVIFEGEVDGANVPTTIINGTLSARTAGMYFDGGPSRIYVKNITAKNFRANSVASGFVFANKGIVQVFTDNLHTQNNIWAGINCDSIGQWNAMGGVHDANTQYNIRARGGIAVSIGRPGDANRMVLKNNVTAAQIRDACTGHFDYVDIINHPTNPTGAGVWVTNVSRVVLNECSLTNCNVGVDVGNGSTFSFNAATTWTNVNTKYRTESNASKDDDAADGVVGMGLEYDSFHNRHSLNRRAWGGNPFSSVAVALCTDKTGTADFGFYVPNSTNARFLIGNVSSNAFFRQEWDFANTRVTWVLNGTARLRVTQNEVNPGTDNVSNLGSGGARWATIFAATGTINTSDARLKTDIEDLDEAERRTAQRLKKLVKKYRFTDAVDEKGDKARIHVGVIAQDVKAAFEAEGLDPFAYAVLCWDKWEAQEAVTRSWSDEYDDDGNLVRAAGSEVIEPAREAGDRYGIRYEELFAFIVAAL